MSEANELLKSLTEDEYASYSEVSPINDVLIIDAETRTINVPSTELLFGVETDKDVERKYFKCPRIVGDNVDLSTLQLRVHYQNANGDKDKYIIEDVDIDGQYITFSWLLSGKVLRYKGAVQFTIVAVSVNQDGTLNKEWNTTLASGNVLEGLEVEDLDQVEEGQARDVLTQLLNMLDERANESIQKVQTEGDSQVDAVRVEGSKQVQAVELKGIETLASIPEDYTTTYNMAEEALRRKADAIVLEADGKTIEIDNSSNGHLLGLNVYGKTEQFTTTGAQNLDYIGASTIIIGGKNLLDISKGLGNNFTESNGAYTLTRNGESSRFSNPIPIYIPAGTPITFSANILEYTKSTESIPLYYKGVSGQSYYASVRKVVTNTYDEDIESLSFYLQSTEEIGAYIKFDKPQLEVGKVMSEYEPYREVQTIYIPYTLRGIQVSSDGNYTDSNGQQWICDEVDFERGVYIQRIKETILDGSSDELWGYHTNIGVQKSGVFTLTAPNAKQSNNRPTMCEHYTNGNKIPINNLEYWGKDSYFGMSQIAFRNDEFTDTTSWRAYLAEHPIRLIYEARDVLETPLTDEEIAAYKALHTNYPNTTIFIDTIAHMGVKYAADTLIYLRDNQPIPTDEQITNAVNDYVEENGLQIPSDAHINSLIVEALKDVDFDIDFDTDPDPDPVGSMSFFDVTCTVNPLTMTVTSASHYSEDIIQAYNEGKAVRAMVSFLGLSVKMIADLTMIEAEYAYFYKTVRINMDGVRRRNYMLTLSISRNTRSVMIQEVMEEGGIEITDGAPTNNSTVVTINPNAEKVQLYTASEIDTMFGRYALEVAQLLGGVLDE